MSGPMHDENDPRCECSDCYDEILELRKKLEERTPLSMLPIPMRLRCPSCHELHIDEGEFYSRVHATHACQHCGEVWRPAIVPTRGVRFLPGFKNADTAE